MVPTTVSMMAKALAHDIFGMMVVSHVMAEKAKFCWGMSLTNMMKLLNNYSHYDYHDDGAFSSQYD